MKPFKHRCPSCGTKAEKLWKSGSVRLCEKCYVPPRKSEA